MEELDADDDGSLSVTESQLSESAFAELDKNGDGAVSSRELRAGLRSKRDELIDLMRSEPGDASSVPGAMSGPTAEQATAMAGLLVEKGDTDGDGALSAAETGLADDMFTSLDTDGDGLLSSGELSSAALAGAIATTLDGKLAVRLTAPATRQDADTTDSTDPTDGGTDTTATAASGAAADTATAQGSTVGAMAARIAQRIVETLDADDSGGLSQSESGLDQDRFAQLDTDGDGSVTANEFGGSLQQMLDVMGALHALSSVARNSYGRRAYGMAAHEAMDRYEGNMGGLMTALFETAPTGTTGSTSAEATGASGGVAATGDSSTSTTDGASDAVGDLTDVLADAAAAEAAQAGTEAAEGAAA